MRSHNTRKEVREKKYPSMLDTMARFSQLDYGVITRNSKSVWNPIDEPL